MSLSCKHTANKPDCPGASVRQYCTNPMLNPREAEPSRVTDRRAYESLSLPLNLNLVVGCIPPQMGIGPRNTNPYIQSSHRTSELPRGRSKEPTTTERIASGPASLLVNVSTAASRRMDSLPRNTGLRFAKERSFRRPASLDDRPGTSHSRGYFFWDFAVQPNGNHRVIQS